MSTMTAYEATTKLARKNPLLPMIYMVSLFSIFLELHTSIFFYLSIVNDFVNLLNQFNYKLSLLIVCDIKVVFYILLSSALFLF